jgi:hypothetical protein
MQDENFRRRRPTLSCEIAGERSASSGLRGVQVESLPVYEHVLRVLLKDHGAEGAITASAGPGSSRVSGTTPASCIGRRRSAPSVPSGSKMSYERDAWNWPRLKMIRESTILPSSMTYTPTP